MSDPSKPKLSLIPLHALAPVARVLEKGLQKNGRVKDDWQKADPQLFLDALLRHLASHTAGDLTDADSGESHLACAATNAIILLWHQQYGGSHGIKETNNKDGCQHDWSRDYEHGVAVCRLCPETGRIMPDATILVSPR